jgi:hypothetical protein
MLARLDALEAQGRSFAFESTLASGGMGLPTRIQRPEVWERAADGSQP